MSKRRINKQQSARIEKIQQTYQIKEHHEYDSLADGLVIARFSKHVEIEDAQGKRIRCAIRPNLDILVAGDRIIWQAEGTTQGVVVSLYPRTSVLARTTNTGLQKPVAANITQMIIVVAAKPALSWSLLDSYLVMAELLKLQAIILLNKIDLPCNEIKNQLVTDYQSLAYPIVMVSQQQIATFLALREVLNHQVSVFVGQSGVGKSSLIAQVLPNEQHISTGALSSGSELGRHTTSNSRYYSIPTGGALIDSPGVREFSLGTTDTQTIARGYREFQRYIGRCKFRNCTHLNTPECAVIEALNKEVISQTRYDNYIQLCTRD